MSFIHFKKIGPTLVQCESDANFLIHPLRRSRKRNPGKTTTNTNADINRELEDDSLAEEEEDGEDAQVVDLAGDMRWDQKRSTRIHAKSYIRGCVNRTSLLPLAARASFIQSQVSLAHLMSKFFSEKVV